MGHGLAPSGQRFLAMEWLDGEDLAQHLSRRALSLHNTLTRPYLTRQRDRLLARTVQSPRARTAESGLVCAAQGPGVEFCRRMR